MSKLNDCIDILKTFAIYNIDLEYSTEHYHITIQKETGLIHITRRDYRGARRTPLLQFSRFTVNALVLYSHTISLESFDDSTLILSYWCNEQQKMDKSTKIQNDDDLFQLSTIYPEPFLEDIYNISKSDYEFALVIDTMRMRLPYLDELELLAKELQMEFTNDD